MIQNARARAKAADVPFLLTPGDIVVPSHCPILGLPLFQITGKKGGGPNSPSLDRIEPSLGYVPGNIVVISNRANRLKSDASIEELRAIASFYATFQRGVRVTGASPKGSK
jgi:hypothetical protein